jgi:hypothetical protein
VSLGVITQDDWSGGIWRLSEPQKAPANTAYDIVNGLLDDQGSVYKRGGTRYLTTPVDANSMRGISDMLLAAGRRTMTWNALNFFALDSADALTAILLPPPPCASPPPLAKPAAMNGMAIFPVSTTETTSVLLLYGGALSNGLYSAGTITVEGGSSIITGSGTSWLGNVVPGAVLKVGLLPIGAVKTVDSNTQITLAAPFHGEGTTSGVAYTLRPIQTLEYGAAAATYVATVGSPARLLLCHGTRIEFPDTGSLVSGQVGNYHELPPDANIIGVDSIQDNAVVFTSAGVYVISGMAYDLTDDYGNVQHRVAQVNKDIVLWGHSGLSGWHGSFIVPAVDDVYLMGLSGVAESIGSPIRDLYRSYVRAGYVPGLATVYRGHYILPILASTGGILATPYNVIDLLICRLDGGAPAWTRFDGAARGYGYTQRLAAQPQLVGSTFTRISDLSGCFEPTAANKTDADNSVFTWKITTQDFSVRRQQATYWKYARLRYQVADAASDNPTLRMQKATGPTGLAWPILGPSDAPADDGTSPFEWFADERSQAIRFRIVSQGPSADARLRNLEVHFRAGAKR